MCSIPQVKFDRNKGQYFTNYIFGTAITPDSDEMVRLGTVSLLRLLRRTASFKAVYQKLAEQDGEVVKITISLDWQACVRIMLMGCVGGRTMV